MKPKKDRTLDLYLEAGAKIRYATEIMSEALMSLQHVLSKKDTTAAINALSKICYAKSKAEDNMLKDFPKLGDEYQQYFYGSLQDPDRDELYRKSTEIARKFADSIFDEN